MGLFNLKKFPTYLQIDQFDCGPACLKILSKFYGKNLSMEHLRDVCHITPDGITIKTLIAGSEKIGYHCVPASIDFPTLSEHAPLPCISYWRNRHFLIIYKIKGDVIYVSDPAHGLLKYNKSEFLEAWIGSGNVTEKDKGIVLLLEPTNEFYSMDNTDKTSGLKGALPYLKNYSQYLVQIFIGLIVGGFIQLVLPFLTQKLVDKGINLGNLNFVYVLLAAQLMLFFSASFISVIRSWLLLYIGARVNMLIASDYLKKLLGKTLSFFDSKTSGDITQRINESARLETFLVNAPDTIFSLINSFIFLLILIYYSLEIFLIFTTGIVLYVVWVWVFMKKRADLDFKRFDSSSAMNSRIIQLVGGIQEVKVNNSERKHIRSWERVRVQYFNTSVANLRLSQFQSIGGNIINEIKNILITFTSAILVMNGEITLGAMLAIQYIVGQVNGPLLGVVGLLRSIQDAKLSMERFQDIDHETEDQKLLNDNTLIQLPKQNWDIEIRNLSFSYTGDVTDLVLRNISLLIPKGKVTAIVGNSGSGKTTLMKLLLKLYLPTQGDIFIDGYNLKHINTSEWRDQCGTVMQDGFIFSASIAENITESLSETAVKVPKLLEAVKLSNLEELVNSLPGGFNSVIGAAGSTGRTLSGGQRQRVLIARAIYKDPTVLLFDEATSALDANNEREIVDNLQEFFVDKTVIIIAHRLSTVKNADQIVVMDNGEIKEIGCHNDLVEKKGYYFKLVKNQLELAS
ncbi:peptidase domain-containing ABC transporter [Olivibacter sp. CPCC 100613]|uniref:peptidase domain-containing ABC transporter n=1 Tax=Olivibacter sp. CPCC 100613 TaxID=3079931 RepID=UPI002FF8137E